MISTACQVLISPSNCAVYSLYRLQSVLFTVYGLPLFTVGKFRLLDEASLRLVFF